MSVSIARANGTREKACRPRHASNRRGTRPEKATAARVPADLFDGFHFAQARQQAVELAAHEAVAFAGARFEALAVEHADFSAAVNEAVAQAGEGDMILTLGAGSVSQLAPQILAALAGV